VAAAGRYGSPTLCGDRRRIAYPIEVPLKRWEAGELGCGQLVFELRRQLEDVDPGDTLEVITHEPGAPVDLPAWCRMTGHTLVSAEHPTYVIRRKAD
jgi:tRNA 2-thiouridine synthesizing protein A